jgi:hypothetical protein
MNNRSGNAKAGAESEARSALSLLNKKARGGLALDSRIES